MNLRRTQAVTLKTGATVNVLPREIPGLKAAGLLSKNAKANRPAKVTPRTDAKVAAAKKVIADRIAAQEAKEKEAQEAEEKAAAKEKEEKDAGKTKEEKGTGGTKEVSGAITTENVKK